MDGAAVRCGVRRGDAEVRAEGLGPAGAPPPPPASRRCHACATRVGRETTGRAGPRLATQHQKRLGHIVLQVFGHSTIFLGARGSRQSGPKLLFGASETRHHRRGVAVVQAYRCVVTALLPSVYHPPASLGPLFVTERYLWSSRLSFRLSQSSHHVSDPLPQSFVGSSQHCTALNLDSEGLSQVL